MNAKLIIPVLLIGLLTFAGCGSAKTNTHTEEKNTHAFTQSDIISDSIVSRELTDTSSIHGLQHITGSLNYSGSEPFLFPTLFESDSSSFRLIGDEKFITETFRKLNGKRVTVYGKVQQRGASKTLEVHYYKVGEGNE